ncbi:MAG: hypothetical protein JXR37_11770 [Kiritimatiellae bacterium]|nr:hypothetical protein [Kiritimatiellia bacterium]
MKALRTGERDGSAIITVLFIVFLVPVVAATVINFSKQQQHQVKIAINQIKAQVIAEAGANEAYAILVGDFEQRTNAAAFPPVDYAGGGYDATVWPVGDDMAVICSTGTHERVASVMLDVKNYGGHDPGEDPTSPWSKAVMVNGTIAHNGAGKCVGDVHSNQELTANGSITWGSVADGEEANVTVVGDFRVNGGADINGDVSAPSIHVTGVNDIHGDENVGPVPPCTYPTLNLTPYYNMAAANGQVYGGGTYNDLPCPENIPGGVAWFNGNVTIRGGATYTGCLISTGDIRFNGTIDQTLAQDAEGNDLPAVMSRDGGVKVNGTHVINGLVYSPGDMTLNGAGSIHGTLIVGGNMDFNGTYGDVYYDYSYPGTPGVDPAGGDIIGVSAWQK